MECGVVAISNKSLPRSGREVTHQKNSHNIMLLVNYLVKEQVNRIYKPLVMDRRMASYG